MHLILATRRSPLARAQTALVAAALEAAGHTTEALEVVTTGDRWSASGTDPAPDRGLFVKELEEALLDGRAHLGGLDTRQRRAPGGEDEVHGPGGLGRLRGSLEAEEVTQAPAKSP